MKTKNSYPFLLKFPVLVLLALCLLPHGLVGVQPQSDQVPFGIVMHGGAGTILKKDMTPQLERAYREKLTQALTAGYQILEKNGSSLDAVEAAIRVLEDSPLFNAGKGAVFTADGHNELDASIMEGKTLNAGAGAGTRRIKNPITLARAVMEHSPHVMLVGEGAEKFAQTLGFALVDNKYFFTERRWKSLQAVREKEKKSASGPMVGFGTVGAVALDKAGNLCAGTSTGGMTNKRFNRIGDSPVIGAGTYADNKTCAVSATGYGEYFIRSVAAYDVSALMAYKGVSIDKAAAAVLEKIKNLGGYGGLIAIDSRGHFTMPFNTQGMYRGAAIKGKKIFVKMYK